MMNTRFLIFIIEWHCLDHVCLQTIAGILLRKSVNSKYMDLCACCRNGLWNGISACTPKICNVIVLEFFQILLCLLRSGVKFNNIFYSRQFRKDRCHSASSIIAYMKYCTSCIGISIWISCEMSFLLSFVIYLSYKFCWFHYLLDIMFNLWCKFMLGFSNVF